MVAAQIPIHAAGAKVGTRQTVLQRNIARNDADAACARLEDFVSEQQCFNFVAEVAQLFHHNFGLVDPASRQVVLKATDAVEVWVEAATRCRLDEVQYVFTIAEGQEHWSDGAQLHAQVAKEQRNVGNSRQFEQNGANPLRTRWRFYAHQFFGCQNERHFVGKTAKPVDAVNKCCHLREGAHFRKFFVAAVHVTTRWFGPHHLLAIQARDDAQSSVRCRVLRPNVEGHALCLKFYVQSCICGLRRDVTELLAVAKLCRDWIVENGHEALSSSVASPPGNGSTSTIPGHGLTMRASSGKSLRIGKPSKSVGKYMLRKSG